MKRLLILTLAVITGCAAHAQIPPTAPPSVALTWQASTSCTAAAPCVYAISRATVTSGTNCPATSGTAYALVGTSTSNATTLTDSNVTPGSYCYIAQTEQGTGSSQQVSAPSSPSNNGTALVVVGPPLAPGAPNATATAKNDARPLLAPEPTKEVAMNAPLTLTARNVR